MVRKATVFIVAVLLQSARAGTTGGLSIPWDHVQPEIEIEPPIVSSDCELIGLCNKVKNYPTKLVNYFLTQLKTLNMTRFQVDTLQMEDVDYENICSYSEEIYYPQAAKDSNGKWHYILNRQPRPFQGFLVERCKKGGCSDGPYSTDYTLKCVQVNTYRQMVYLNIEKKMLLRKHFEVPTCCSCSLV